ncbi:MAG TPA: hypothetical protein H9815_01610 [Candidatus Ruania gallistercoris]|uniref:Uncharacterized protein n=1 Tax=Candidatus Ruania gallistercoris TaxID=2838746 RepID=A0A9D2J2P6_9MICO|nr:hypothetical protein [Candidatus Ruania gallistercoris]
MSATPPDPAGSERPRKRRPRRAVDPGLGPEPVWQGAAWEDDPRTWGDRDGSEDPERDGDERILRERPPHW